MREIDFFFFSRRGRNVKQFVMFYFSTSFNKYPSKFKT